MRDMIDLIKNYKNSTNSINEDLRLKEPIGMGKDHQVFDYEADPTKVIKVAWGAKDGENRFDPNAEKIQTNLDPNHIRIFTKYPNIFPKVFKATDRYAIIEKLNPAPVLDDEKKIFQQLSKYNFSTLRYMKEYDAVSSLYWNITNRSGFLISMLKKLTSAGEDLTILNKYLTLFKQINSTLKRAVGNVDVGTNNMGYDQQGNVKLLDF